MADLDDLSRTAMVPLWARAQDARSAQPILGDKAAENLADVVRGRFGSVPVDQSTQVGCCLRNRIVDKWVSQIVGRAGDSGLVIDVGVGLDTRLSRRPEIGAHYVEIDTDSIIQLRDAWLPGTGAVRIAADGMNPIKWIEHVPAIQSTVTVLILEGVLAYQTPARAAQFFAKATELLPGAYILFDSMTPLSAWLANRSSLRTSGRPRYLWSPRRTRLISAGGLPLRVLEEMSFVDVPRHMWRAFPRRDRLVHALPPLRRSYRLTLGRLPAPGDRGQT